MTHWESAHMAYPDLDSFQYTRSQLRYETGLKIKRDFLKVVFPLQCDERGGQRRCFYLLPVAADYDSARNATNMFTG